MVFLVWQVFVRHVISAIYADCLFFNDDTKETPTSGILALVAKSCRPLQLFSTALICPMDSDKILTVLFAINSA